MATANGTSAAGLCSGVERYIDSSGYVCKTLQFRGWRPMPAAQSRFDAGLMPTMDWIKKAIANPHGAAWVDIGWYVHSAPGECRRVGGHWLAVVGYGIDGDGREDPDILLVDNPAIPFEDDRWSNPDQGGRPSDGGAMPARSEVAEEVMLVEPAGHGRLVGDLQGLPRDAAGMYFVSGAGVGMPEKYDAAFMDGAVVLIVGDGHR
jgi:hypothetical protein